MKLLFLLLGLNTFLSLKAVERNTFYNTLSGNSLENIDNTIKILEKEKATPIINAYKGSLLMKKSSFITKPKEKLAIFKTGRMLLEEEIEKQPNNIEMRLLRLIIQENCPKILKYNTQLEEDKIIIIKGFSSSEKDLKSIIKDYSKTSKILNPKDFI